MRVAPLKGSPEEKIGKLEAENERLRAALERIANLDSPPDGRYAIIAREALR